MVSQRFVSFSIFRTNLVSVFFFFLFITEITIYQTLVGLFENRNLFVNKIDSNYKCRVFGSVRNFRILNDFSNRTPYPDLEIRNSKSRTHKLVFPRDNITVECSTFIFYVVIKFLIFVILLLLFNGYLFIYLSIMYIHHYGSVSYDNLQSIVIIFKFNNMCMRIKKKKSKVRVRV